MGNKKNAGRARRKAKKEEEEAAKPHDIEACDLCQRCTGMDKQHQAMQEALTILNSRVDEIPQTADASYAVQMINQRAQTISYMLNLYGQMHDPAMSGARLVAQTFAGFIEELMRTQFSAASHILSKLDAPTKEDVALEEDAPAEAQEEPERVPLVEESE